MKRIAMILVAGMVITACNDTVSVNVKTDSLDTKFEEKAEKVWDSTKAGLKDAGRKLGDKAEELGEKAGDKLKNIGKKDSVNN